jgi:catechol 2,3-dioxygenase-like lactoylglutathione lyase family enzyme
VWWSADLVRSGEPPMSAGWQDLSNLGIKVRDLDEELAFLEACGATEVQKLTQQGREFGMAFLGTQRLFLFPKVIYEDKLAEPLHYGLTHIVYEVTPLEPLLDQLKAAGIVPFFGPEEVVTPFNRRRIVFYRTPSGFIFEAFEILP